MFVRAFALLFAAVAISVAATMYFGQEVLIALGLILTQAKVLMKKIAGLELPAILVWLKAQASIFFRIELLKKWITTTLLPLLLGRALLRRIAAWTGDQDAYALMDRLQESGVEAGVVQNDADLLRDPQLAHRGHFVPLEHARLGELACERSGFRLASAEGGYERAAPLLGEHNEEILGGVLGLDAEEIARLVESEVVV